MRHLIICREYPPAPSGGIGTYVVHIARLLAERGETVHVIGQRWKGATRDIEEHLEGRLVIHRVACRDWRAPEPVAVQPIPELEGLFRSGYYPQAFGWQASLRAEQLVKQHEIDLIEAQEFEAPLYYLQLRRALGLGPRRTPPCLVHVHSPTEFIVRHNEWNIHQRFWRTAKRLESYTIAAADHLLCPSRYLAAQAEQHYGLPAGSIATIPLPAPTLRPIERSEETWRHGSLLYVGRLELRKGVLEWLQAAVALARRDPTLRFEFVGGNVLGTGHLSGTAVLRRLVPSDLARRFVFHGNRPYSELPLFLTRARLAVVPSRWENFPNTCVEAMCSGLPVLASATGGMREIVEDGRTGWLAASASPLDLTAALERALSTPPAQLAAMGRLASEAIHRLCNRDEIVERHMALRRELARQGARQSLSLPTSPGAGPPGGGPSRPAAEDAIAVVVTCSDSGTRLTECVENLRRQRRQPSSVVVVDLSASRPDALQHVGPAAGDCWTVVPGSRDDSARAKNLAVETILGAGLRPLAFVFLEADNHLAAGALDLFDRVLRHCPEVGLVSSWVAHPGSTARISMPPNPSFPYQWVLNDAAPFAAIRTRALQEAGGWHSFPSQAYQAWDLANAVMEAGWVAVTVPEILGQAPFPETAGLAPVRDHRYGEMRRALLSRFPQSVARDGCEIVLLTESLILDACQDQLVRLRQSRTLARQLVDKPRSLALRVVRKVKRTAERWRRP